MKMVLIDDDPLALDYLEHLLNQISGHRIVGRYTNPVEGREAVLSQDVDVVFLDIHMPEINGIELAKQLIEHKPGIEIVFVTAFDEHAVRAFELHALDYLLKPVTMERLRKTLRRIHSRSRPPQDEPPANPNHAAPVMNVTFFRHFSASIEGNPIPFRWRTNKSQELFLYLLQCSGQIVRKSTLIDLLWPDHEADKAFSLLYTSIYHIRKTLGEYSDYFKLMNESDGYIIVTHNVVTDVRQLEQLEHTAPIIDAATIRTYENVLSLYQGDYLQDVDYWWVEGERHRLKSLWIRMMMSVASYFERSGDRNKAILYYGRICERCPAEEEAHFALMKLYAAQQQNLAVHRQYRLLEAAVWEELNEKPSAYIRDWYQKWKQNG